MAAHIPHFTKIIPITKISDAEGTFAEEHEELARWIEQTREGQLAVDMYETSNDVVIVAAVAGVDPEHLEITIENDIVMIRGTRARKEEEQITRSHYGECYWGPFSRSILIPHPVNKNEARAEFSRGVLTIHLPKISDTYLIPVIVEEDEINNDT